MPLSLHIYLSYIFLPKFRSIMKLQPIIPSLAVFFCYYFLHAAAEHVVYPSSASSLADQVCKNTTNCTFCEQAIFSDSRAPTADRYVLAYISFGLAYVNATHTLNYTDSLLHNATTPTQAPALRKCRSFYVEAVKALSRAFNDLDSETFSSLDQYARTADGVARRCEGQFVVGSSPLSKMNRNLRGLSEICIVVSALYQASVNY
ncbi:hypothetical protein M9H77_29575 [Catharanthus roseus]|uniref:Uncharacterized protein n=1 Tax=Catharanthus roseus TaxID=4058 RepID=A0ACB9ZZ17_CATRO|nr:hypothetical protein M9H77_29575 [Catharanthus roseus]